MAGLKFRVLLDSGDHEIFRDIVISDNADFEQFYRTIMAAYGFEQEEMASFYMSNNSWDKGHEIALFDMSYGDDPELIQPGVMKESIIRKFIEYPDQKIILVHDFIRMWIFLIELIEVVKENPSEPKVVLSVGKAPKEDSRTGNEDNLRFESELDEEDEDEFGFDDFEEGLDEGDFDYYE